MGKSKKSDRVQIPALKVQQWLDEWDKIHFDPKARQSKPSPQFYLCSIPAGHLKALTGVYRRSTKGGVARAKDPNVQRGHEEQRSKTIRDFVQYGFPWCEMGDAKRSAPGAIDLRKPGWLPTAIIVNILEQGAVRNESTIPDNDLVTIDESNGATKLVLPKGFEGPFWEPQKIFPFEVIDGQHRLWAFDDFDPGDTFELPIVAFHGLDRSWQAYLFWSVNITPKRINRSLAFDLYPLLRREDWLDKFAGHSIYRETRCQELVEALWSHPLSPWHQRINMLGETVTQRGNEIPMVSQAAWVRSLMASFVKEWVEQGVRIGGLFGAPRSIDEPLLPWNRAMQAGFLIYAGSALLKWVKATKSKWSEHLRGLKEETLFDEGDDLAFYGKYSLLTTDQGIRGFLFTANDLCYTAADSLGLASWRWEEISGRSKTKSPPATDEDAVALAVESLKNTKIGKFLDQVAKALASYDWRTSATPDLKNTERLRQAVFRGSSGYKELRRQLLEHLKESDNTQVSDAASATATALGVE